MKGRFNKQNKSESVWYSYQGTEYLGNAPSFYNPGTFEWVQEFEEGFDQIRQEIKTYLIQREDDFVPYFFQDVITKPDSWHIITYYLWRQKEHKNLKGIKGLNVRFEKIPGFVSAALSKLKAGSEIKSHKGDTSGIIRCHFPIVVPGQIPQCGFQVRNETRSWEEGKMLLFCDAYDHKAFNLTDEDRLVLIIDIIRPEFIHKKTEIATNALSILWAQRIISSVPFLNLPWYVKGSIRHFCKWVIYLYIPIQRKLSFL